MVADRSGHLNRLSSFVARATNYGLQRSLAVTVDKPRDALGSQKVRSVNDNWDFFC